MFASKADIGGPPEIKTRAAEARRARFQLYAGRAEAVGSDAFEKYRDAIDKWCTRRGVKIDSRQITERYRTLSVDNFARNLTVVLSHFVHDGSTGTRLPAQRCRS